MEAYFLVIFGGMGPSNTGKEVRETELAELAVCCGECSECGDVLANTDGGEVFDDWKDFVRFKGHGEMIDDRNR